MTKPLHVGRAAENGVTAALLAAQGFTADPAALDGPWGFFSVMGEGATELKFEQGFGKQLTIIDPGVSIKPYPSGILTHQSMDAMMALVLKHDLKPEEIVEIRFYAGKNIIEPIRYPVAVNHLQAKFSDARAAVHDRHQASREPSRIHGRFRRRSADAGSAAPHVRALRRRDRRQGLRSHSLAHRGHHEGRPHAG